MCLISPAKPVFWPAVSLHEWYFISQCQFQIKSETTGGIDCAIIIKHLVIINNFTKQEIVLSNLSSFIILWFEKDLKMKYWCTHKKRSSRFYTRTRTQMVLYYIALKSVLFRFECAHNFFFLLIAKTSQPSLIKFYLKKNTHTQSFACIWVKTKYIIYIFTDEISFFKRGLFSLLTNCRALEPDQ